MFTFNQYVEAIGSMRFSNELKFNPDAVWAKVQAQIKNSFITQSNMPPVVLQAMAQDLQSIVGDFSEGEWRNLGNKRISGEEAIAFFQAVRKSGASDIGKLEAWIKSQVFNLSGVKLDRYMGQGTPGEEMNPMTRGEKYD